jgi:predicted GNAT superfamily acetyltransferase
MIEFRTARPDDAAEIVALNDAVSAVTSPMDMGRFATLLELSHACLVAAEDRAVLGFVLAMRDGAAYPNPNFDWFSERLKRFLYIDRIVVGPAARGKGLGRQLYDRVGAVAKADGCLLMAAEIDIDPPNTGSLQFHEKYGFAPIGRRRYETGKVVSMQIKGL